MISDTQKNRLLSLAMSFACGLLFSISLATGKSDNSFLYLAGALLGLTFAGYISFCILDKIGEFRPAFKQLARFAMVGALSTFIELAILNTSFFVTGVTSGIFFSAFKSATFLLALVNSFIFNRYWTFGKLESHSNEEFTKFFTVNLVGLLINVGTASLVVNVIGPQFGIGSLLWANIGAMTAVFVVMVWNFLLYKFFVFKK